MGTLDPLFYFKGVLNVSALKAKLEALAEPLLDSMAMELVDLEVTRRGRKLYICLFVDYLEGGVTVEACAEANREFGRLLDVEDLVSESYVLEVSSPGLNRRLRKLKDFQRFLDSVIKVETWEKLDGRKRFRGKLLEADETRLVLEQDGAAVAIPFREVQRANLEYDFTQPK